MMLSSGVLISAGGSLPNLYRWKTTIQQTDYPGLSFGKQSGHSKLKH